MENQSLTKMNAVNESYIEQLEADLSHLRQVNDDEIRAKKKWRNATLLIISGIVVYLAL
jgi:hypothetical protein